MAANGRVMISMILMVVMVMNMTWCVNSKGYGLGISPEELKSCIETCIPEKCMPEANNLSVCEKACHKFCNRPAFKSYYVIPQGRRGGGGFVRSTFCKLWC